MSKPFRWNIEKRNELGSLINEGSIEIERDFILELIESIARIIAFSDNSKIFFIGRSPENYFDFLKGVYCENRRLKQQINLFQFSGRRIKHNELTNYYSPKLSELRNQMSSIGLSPKQILSCKYNTALVDLVYSGSTMQNLITILKHWANQEKSDWNNTKTKLRIVGITERTKNSPYTWRWQQQTDSLEILAGIKIKNVSVSRGFWTELGDDQSKVTPSNSISKWDTNELTKPIINKEHIEGLNFAFNLNNLGKNKKVKNYLKAKMNEQSEMNYKWFKDWKQGI